MATIEELKAAAEAAVAAYHSALCAQHKFQVGDVIRSTNGKLAKVTKLWVEKDRVYTLAVLMKPNGQWGARSAPFWTPDWIGATFVEHGRPLPPDHTGKGVRID